MAYYSLVQQFNFIKLRKWISKKGIFSGHTNSVRIQVFWLTIQYTFQCLLLFPGSWGWGKWRVGRWGKGGRGGGEERRQCFSPEFANTKVVPWSSTVVHIFYKSIYIREKVPRWNFSFHSKFPDSWCFKTDHGGKILEWSSERLININGSQVVAVSNRAWNSPCISSSRPI